MVLPEVEIDEQPNFRPIEAGVTTDLTDKLSYAGYLRLDRLLDAQQPVSDHHDEMLFIVQHQVTELWLKLLIHELRSAMALIGADDVPPALKRLARVKHILHQMFEQWAVLETLTPIEYAQFRGRARRRLGIPVAAIPHRRVPARQQEPGHGGRLRPRPGRPGRPDRAP